MPGEMEGGREMVEVGGWRKGEVAGGKREGEIVGGQREREMVGGWREGGKLEEHVIKEGWSAERWNLQRKWTENRG